MTWTPLDTWIVVVGALGAVSCALVGNYLVLRRMSMMGDAISHAVLPGLAAAFLITGSRSSPVMFLGAAVVGVLTALFTEWIRRLGRVEQSASMGVVFTTLFALGLVMIVRAADAVDLDPGCVLYGAIELTPLDRVEILGGSVPRAAVQLAIVLALDAAVVILLYKELAISSFDPDLATTLGFRSALLHYLLMTLVAVTTVASFESVGSILVIAMLIVPPAAAHLLTDRLRPMILVSLVLAVASAALGHLAAIALPPGLGIEGVSDTNTAGMMAVVAGVLFGLALLFSPRHGIVSRAVTRVRLAFRITREDVLGLLYRREEGRRATPAVALVRQSPAGPFVRRAALRSLARAGLIERQDGDLRLTEAGTREARAIIRAHRLWESYLFRHLDLPIERLHRPAEEFEHVTDAEMRARLAEQTDRPDHDPMGKPIP